MIEVIALAYARQYGIDVVIPRFATVYGPTRFIPDTAFFEFIRKGIAGEDIALNNSNLPRRDNIYIDDAVDGVLTVAARGENMEAYNISSNGDLGNFASVGEIAETVASVSDKMFGRSIKVNYTMDVGEKRKPGFKMSNEKLKYLGWNTRNSMEEAIKKTIEAISDAS